MSEVVNMGKMGNGYGSEFHLLRYLGYHRQELNRAIEKETGGLVTEWLDFAFGRKGKLDREWQGVDFVESPTDVKAAYMKFWPQTGNVPNWDSVGRLESDSVVKYILVEAKAHVEELQSSCSAKKSGGLDTICEALDATIKNYGFASKGENWLSPFYQYSNRLAHLHFLMQHNIPAHLVFIYFCGDNWRGEKLPSGKPPKCPKEAQQWEAYLNAIHDRLGLSGKSKLEERVHSLFLHV